MPNIYFESKPSDNVGAFVDCYWWLRAGDGDESRNPFKILPDGCVDIVFNAESAASAVVVGALTESMSAPLSPNSKFFGIRLNPGAAYWLLGLSAAESTNKVLSLGGIWKAAERHFFKLRGLDETEQKKGADELVFRQMSRAIQPEPRVQDAVDRIVKSAGNISISTLSDELGLSRQHFARTFRDHIGFSPKVFSRIVRMRAVVDLVAKLDRPDWASLAADFGYFDQAHMISDFKNLTGATPTEFRHVGG